MSPQLQPIDRIAPTARPRGRPAGFQRWLRLLFVHWEIDAEAAAATLPDGLELDTFEGRAYVGVVAFTMRDVAPRWSPSVPGISHFHELNVRTYVVKDGVPGVWFYSLDAAATIAVIVARTGWDLPYHRASMDLADRDGVVHYTSRRRWPGPKPAHFEARYRVGERRACAVAGTFDHFLVERYVLFAGGGKRGLRIGRVHHQSYPLAEVTLDHVEQSMVTPIGLEIRGAPIVHYSPGVDVDVYALEG
jgi:uncharacterized protein YqjF (DUF2071 family)